jgi:PD-(D/E)XK endonuclease
VDRPVADKRRPRLINRSRQGDLGEASAIEWLTRAGAAVFTPIGHSPDFDVVADVDGRLLRVQVKTSTCRAATPAGGGTWHVALRTSGGNRSWTGVAKTMDPSRADYVFTLTGDGRRWFIPTDAIEGRHRISLGGLKYSEFEIEPTRSITDLVYGRDEPTLESDGVPGEYRSGQPGRAVNAVAMPTQVRILPPPFIDTDDGEVRSARQSTGARTRISKNHPVTIPMSQFQAAELRTGDRFRVMATGPGRVELARIDEPCQLPLEPAGG